MIDTHAHLEFPSFKADLDEVIAKSFEKGLSHIVNVGGNLERNERCLEIAKGNKDISAVVGIHPEDCDIDPFAQAMAKLREIAKDSQVVAIGETGFDFKEAQATKETQQDFFEEQIKISQELDLPLVLHIRDAYPEALEVLKNNLKDGQKFVVHCFSGSAEQAKTVLDMGGLISFTGIVTFPNAKGLESAVEVVPLEKVMVETDCPFLAPQEVRGKRCEPWHVIYTARKIAKLRGISLEELEQATDKNAKEFFGI